MCARLAQSPDEHIWDLGGRSITQLLVDPSGFRFRCWTLDADLEVRFETPFSFRGADGREHDIDPEQPRTIAPLLDLIRTGVSEIRVLRSGEVAITLSDRSSIHARSHPVYEAWEIAGAGGLSGIGYLCGPGGGSPVPPL